MGKKKYFKRYTDFNHVKWQIWTIELWHKWYWKLLSQETVRAFWN